MIPLAEEENKFYKEQETCYICKEKFCMYKDMKIIKITGRLNTTVITQENLEELLIANAT